MFSLTYSIAYDPYHAVFRMLSLFGIAKAAEPIPFETVRIIDFYHVFPWLLGDFSAYSKIQGFQKSKNEVLREYPRPRFEILPDKQSVFQRMEPFQVTAKAALLGRNAIAAEGGKLYAVDERPMSEELLAAVGSYREQNNALLSFLVEKLAKVPLLGPGGLKERSGLGEFRYDAV